MPEGNKLFDTIFDVILYLSIVTCFVLGCIIAVTGTVIALQTMAPKLLWFVTAGVLYLIAIILSMYMIYLKSWSAHARR